MNEGNPGTLAILVTLLKPRLWSLGIRRFGAARPASPTGRGIRQSVIALIGALFWVLIFTVSLRVLTYFNKIEMLGDLLAYKLLAMLLVTLFSLLIFSNILAALSKLYLSRDLSLVHALPVPTHLLYLARWIEGSIDSAWMVLLYSMPVLIPYGIVFKASPAYYTVMILATLALAIIAAALSSGAVLLAVLWIPASRIRTLFLVLGVSLFIVLLLTFRMLRPERLADPEAFTTVMAYLDTLRAPTSLYLPSTWAYSALHGTLTGAKPLPIIDLALLFSCAGALGGVMVWAAGRYYYPGYAKSQTAAPRPMGQKVWSGRGLQRWVMGPRSTIALKEVRSFLRDQAQWTQLMLICALVVIYLFNFKALPLEKAPIKTIYLQNLLSFLNVGLASFVLTAIAARFAFPAVSNEGEAIWIIHAAPLSLRTFLWVKYAAYLIPLFILTEILVVMTNLLLNVTPFMMLISTATICLTVPGVVSLAVGLGAAYPDFKAETPAQAATGFGGLLFMMLAAIYIGAVLILEAGPVYTIMRAGFEARPLSGREQVWIVLNFGLSLVIHLAIILYPMRWGKKRLARVLQ
jgi:ABC-2 type transport system permease protein